MTETVHVGALPEYPAQDDFICLDPAFGTRFMLFVDTEEEFDWSGPFSRTAHSVTALKGMARAQSYFAAHGVTPLYVTDYPVVSSRDAAAMMREWVDAGQADIGVHLHPWVNPPFAEEVCLANSYAGFLPPALEKSKLIALCDRIAEVFGRRPIAYRAGRYGIGPNTAAILEELGFRLDSSVRSRFDYRGQLGPDLPGMPLQPYWAGPRRTLVELPLSTAFTGLLGGQGDRLYHAALRMPKMGGALARTRLLSRVPLTPEGVPLAEAKVAIDALLAEGLPVLNFSFHSPTVEPGHTPYVRNQADLDNFYHWWDGVFAHLSLRGVRPASLEDFLNAVPPRAGAANRTCQAA